MGPATLSGARAPSAGRDRFPGASSRVPVDIEKEVTMGSAGGRLGREGRPVVPDELPAELRDSPFLGVEVDALPGGETKTKKRLQFLSKRLQAAAE